VKILINNLKLEHLSNRRSKKKKVSYIKHMYSLPDD